MFIEQVTGKKVIMGTPFFINLAIVVNIQREGIPEGEVSLYH